mmetsp:Transcript_20050/g.32068  ORF Transcript_20050/g.32068 Transcript_20050/m.32068 type:complete len:100 (-) Transcript_20050:919-1218(-)
MADYRSTAQTRLMSQAGGAVQAEMDDQRMRRSRCCAPLGCFLDMGMACGPLTKIGIARGNSAFKLQSTRQCSSVVHLPIEPAQLPFCCLSALCMASRCE